MDNLLTALDELSRTTDRIEGLNPNALEEMGDALTARSRVMIQIHQTVVDGQSEASPEVLNRLSKELERGSELIRRLKLVQARLRSDYQQSRQQRNMLGGIHASSASSKNSLDIQG
jgi:hypothetical protein